MVHAQASIEKMDEMLSAAAAYTVTYDSAIEYEDFPKSDEPVHILGRVYSTWYDMDELKHDILSRLWFTYRKGYRPICGTGPTSDTHWGCMLRCGQMMLAQALLTKHLGRDWRWYRRAYDKKYFKILELFQDKKSSLYSIHQIAAMGVSEGKSVGQWFGPNTITQVLRKLSSYDEWGDMAIHIAMDNTIVVEDIYRTCKIQIRSDTSTDTVDIEASSSSVVGDGAAATTETPNSSYTWKSLLLIIPLRLGLSDINCVYFDSLKVCLTLPQSVGIIGGKPNHAHWFIGHVGNELVYLDPHTTQSVKLAKASSDKPNDDSYHCAVCSRMNISKLDPSIALGFICNTEKDFEDLCSSFIKDIITKSKTPMFELHQSRPPHWPPLNVDHDRLEVVMNTSDYSINEDRHYDTDDEYELL